MNFILERFKNLNDTQTYALKGLFRALICTAPDEDNVLNKTLLMHFYPRIYSLSLERQLLFPDYLAFQKELEATQTLTKYEYIEDAVSILKQWDKDEFTPDYKHWARKDWWTPEEAILLTCKLDPNSFKLEELLEFSGLDETPKKALQLKELIDRSKIGELSFAKSIGSVDLHPKLTHFTP